MQSRFRRFSFFFLFFLLLFSFFSQCWTSRSLSQPLFMHIYSKTSHSGSWQLTQASWLLHHEVILVAQPSQRLAWVSQGSKKALKWPFCPPLWVFSCSFMKHRKTFHIAQQMASGSSIRLARMKGFSMFHKRTWKYPKRRAKGSF